jgi:hypothetical protein
MKKAIQLGILILGMSGCAVTIPLQTNLSEQTLLLAKNRNLKANYTLNSDVPNGYIDYVTVSKNGSETASSGTYMYENETAFRSIWDSYFSNKFNEYSKKEIDITVKMMNLYLVQKNLTSGARGALLGNVQMNVEAVCEIDVKIDFNGETYGKKITSKVSEYNESQSTNINGTIYTSNASNPTQQKAKLLEQCLNRAVIQFENYLGSVLAE